MAKDIVSRNVSNKRDLEAKHYGVHAVGDERTTPPS